ncbi:MAG TPA: oligosaccharide flippase family protein [Solirubrobacteraceae bacterium]|nr:oligosaccharide flippase family protein [Solirubrobacteraceae bacterium]
MSTELNPHAAEEIVEVIPDGDILASREAGGRFLRGSGMRIVGFGAGLLVGLAATPFVTRHLGPSNWGHFITVTSLIFIAAALTEGGVGNLGIREFATSGEAERRLFMSDLFGLRLVLSLIGALGAFAFALAAGYPAVMVAGTAIACVGLVIDAARVTLAIPLTAMLRLGWLAVSDFTAQVATAVLMITLVLAGAALLPFYAVASLVAALTLVLTIALVRSDVNLRPSFSPSRWRALMSESIVYTGATTLGVIYFQIVVIAMSLLSSKLQTGYFSLAFRGLSIINGIPWLLVASAFPILAHAAHNDEQRLRYALQRLFDGSVVVGGFFSLCVVIGAPFGVRVIGGPKFEPSVQVLQILGAGILGTFLVATWSFALLTLRLYRELIVINGAAVLLAVLLSVLLIPAHAADGAAVTTVTLEIALALAYGVVLSIRRPELRPSLGQLPRVALALGVSFAVAVVIPVSSLVAVVVGVAVLACSLLALRAVPHEFLHAIRRNPGG